MKTLAMTQRAKTILILSMLLLAVVGSLAAQSGTKDRVRKRAHRIFAAQTGPDQVTLAWDEVPGTTEYHIYLPDPTNPGPPAPGSRPTMSFSGSGRRATVTGVQRMADGAYLEALGQGEVLYRGTFNAIARAALAPPTAPAAVQARETGGTEVTLTWNPVPGATAYMISRAVGGSGWQMLCDVCPPGGDFVDTAATPGVEHTYSIAAIFPLGISARTPSNKLTVGAAQLAAVAARAPQAAVWDKPMSTGTPVAGTEADNTNVGASAGTPTTGTTTTTTGTTTTGTGTGTGTPTGWPQSGIPAGTQPPVSGSAPVHGATPVTSTPTTPAVGGLPPVGGSEPVHSATPVASTPAAASCKLDYQRADTMWADIGRPDGFLGVESISLPNGQAKVFVTDWAYEKQRNDSLNYYGSHLRVATNPGNGVVQLRLKNPALAMFGRLGAAVVTRLGAPGWLIMKPGDRAEFKDDLMEVRCGQ